MNLKKILIKNYQLVEGEEGIHIDVEFYINENNDELTLYISHNGSSGVQYNNIKTSIDVGNAIIDYVENNL